MSTVFVVTQYDIYQDSKTVHSVHSTEEKAKAAQDAIDASPGQHAFYEAFELDAPQEKPLTYGYYAELEGSGAWTDKVEGTGYPNTAAARVALDSARAGRKGQSCVVSIEGWIAPTTLGLLIKSSSPLVKEV